MENNVIPLGPGNISEEDKKDRLYTIGFIAVIVVVFVALAIVIGGSYTQNSNPISVTVPTPTPQAAVQSATDQQLTPVESTPFPEDTATPTPIATPTATLTPAQSSLPEPNPGYVPTFEGQTVEKNGLIYNSYKKDNVLLWTTQPVPTPTDATPDPTPGS